MGLLLLAVGIYSLFSNFRGFIIIGLGVFMLLIEGSEFDFTDRKYRKTKSILGFTIGKWQPLPEIEYVSVFKTTETTTLRQTSAEANVKTEVIKLNLFYENNKRIETYRTYDIEDAFKKAKDIATLLNVDILDATEKESKWL
ncbi:MAG: hypothetical protein HKP48_05120 [Winogradskyella sp.]|uniref:hypothetical protein n=1 Tax=Winogradskyella sp. TaxID=1883156 RepID=UPI00181122C0|nr:hypothetical protein [Winogradskyella sp.]MBT8244604.1 hypothetical protein [Winogradskyella sp.]NNK22680.1 hypothetical protein [Winogradskyella sp.]